MILVALARRTSRSPVGRPASGPPACGRRASGSWIASSACGSSGTASSQPRGRAPLTLRLSGRCTCGRLGRLGGRLRGLGRLGGRRRRPGRRRRLGRGRPCGRRRSLGGGRRLGRLHGLGRFAPLVAFVVLAGVRRLAAVLAETASAAATRLSSLSKNSRAVFVLVCWAPDTRCRGQRGRRGFRRRPGRPRSAGTWSRARGSASRPGRATSRPRTGAPGPSGVKTPLSRNVGPSGIEAVQIEARRGVRLVERPLLLGEQLAEPGSRPATASRTSGPVDRPFIEPEHTNPPGNTSTSTLKAAEWRTRRAARWVDRSQLDDRVALGRPGSGGRARRDRPRSRARSGVSKKKTWRGCASTGSIGRLAIVARCASAGTVSFSSTLSASLISDIIRTRSASDRRGASAARVGSWGSSCRSCRLLRWRVVEVGEPFGEQPVAKPTIADGQAGLVPSLSITGDDARAGQDDLRALRLESDDLAPTIRVARPVLLDLPVDLGSIEDRALDDRPGRRRRGRA